MELENLIYESTRKERIYTIGDLEYLSSTQLYSFSGPLGPNLPSSPLRMPIIKPLVSSLPDFSRQFNLLNNYGSEKRETYLEKLEREAKEREEQAERLKEDLNKIGKTFSILPKKSEPLGNDFISSGFQFHFHENDGLITGGKIISYNRKEEEPLNNYQISMGDLYANLLGIKKIKPGE